jgi:ATP adenylyltransferase
MYNVRVPATVPRLIQRNPMKRSFAFLDSGVACAALEGEGPPWDQVLHETDNFVVVPTAGALVEGWVLIVTKAPFLCMGALEHSLLDELYRLKDYVCSVLSRCYGEIAVFEHGPSVLGQKMGCGVDHAHMHVLPAAWDLLNGVPKITDLAIDWRSAEGVDDAAVLHRAGVPYLFLEQPLGTIKIAPAHHAPSQLFRRVVANYIGSPDEFDWRMHPMEPNVLATIRTLQHGFPASTSNPSVRLVAS